MGKKDINIRSYDGQDAYYSGSDADYEEFLKNADVSIDGADAEPVENTQRINLNETINLQGVIDKFRKTAGGIGQGAKNIKDSVVNKMETRKAKKEEVPEEDTSEAAEAEEKIDIVSDIKAGAENITDAVTEKIASTMQSSEKKLDAIKGEMAAISEMPDKVGDVDKKLNLMGDSLAIATAQLTTVTEKLEALEKRLSENKQDGDKVNNELLDTLDEVGENVAGIKQSVVSVSKLNDSVFDLKNTQLNTKNAISNLETAFTRLKKKCVLGITVLSILCVIIIALQVLLLLS